LRSCMHLPSPFHDRMQASQSFHFQNARFGRNCGVEQAPRPPSPREPCQASSKDRHDRRLLPPPRALWRALPPLWASTTC
jgi:hypothetical protein